MLVEDPQELYKHIKEVANSHLSDIFSYFDIGIENDNGFNEIRCSCPIHRGDNKTSFFYDKDKMYWRCFSHLCHEQYKGDIFGLLSGLFEVYQNKKMSFYDCVAWLKSFLKIDIEASADIDPFKVEINKFISSKKLIKNIKSDKQYSSKKIEFKPIPLINIKDEIKPSNFFAKQFSEETLRKFYIGDCEEFGKPMYKRSYCLVLDDTGDNIVGVSGRTWLNECTVCGEYHIEGKGCPIDNPAIKSYPKWYHYGFASSTTLYNVCNAKKYIEETGSVIITEGPKDVWWLDQHGIYNCIAMFGLSLHKEHIRKLLKLGVRKLIMCLDNDNGGEVGSARTIKNAKDLFTITNISKLLPEGKDIADTSSGFMEKLKKVVS